MGHSDKRLEYRCGQVKAWSNIAQGHANSGMNNELKARMLGLIPKSFPVSTRFARKIAPFFKVRCADPEFPRNQNHFLFPT